ncbi:calcitonin gene-related peptide type 1 receptor-like [Plakobranchus ocellatus]|uniref:Calcitonin gene-related peptide type 1 receptor-like n=1 Tax=Plakobranchus ocellatus TaxID=259542 RepID=A0AAV4E0I8_9GAST|nr:calcitonin gene-related peptide type 1 receptor-like [Plakobranchus ocellatus]
MASESETSQDREAEVRKATNHLDQVVAAIKAIGAKRGSTRDEIVHYLVSRDLMHPKIAKALVAKALYKGIEQGIVKRPRGSHNYLVKNVSMKKKRSRGHRTHDRHSRHSRRRHRHADSDTKAGTSRPNRHTRRSEKRHQWGSKFCTPNGTWYTDDIKGQEWSDYTSCIPLQKYRQLFYVAVICHALSVVLTVPALGILLAFRQLRRQHRIQIHVNLLFSLLMTSVVWIVWEDLVYRDRLENTDENAFMHQDAVGCKILYSLTRYTLSTSYFWAFLEGAHLFRLIANAFVVPKNIRAYFVFGWIGPLIFVSIYIGHRIYYGHGGCWIRMFESYEWWIYTPNLIILLCNVVFLVWIVVSLTIQIQVHPNEPSSYRRALKAIVVLTPLFGLQMLVFIYGPEGAGYSLYEFAAVVVKCSQGAVVALILCYMNKEVRTQIRLRLKTVKQNSWWTERLPRTMQTRASRRQSQGFNNKKSDQTVMDLTLRQDGGNVRSTCLYDMVSIDAPPPNYDLVHASDSDF